MNSNILCILLAIFALSHIVCARINVGVDMDPRELESLGAVLVETYLHHNLIQHLPTMRNAILQLILKIPGAVFV